MKKLTTYLLSGMLCFGALFPLAACGKGDTSQDTTQETLQEATITDATHKVVIESSSLIGGGGYGAIFEAAIDPFNPTIFAARCDMGCVYVSQNAGESWTRHNINGTLYALKFDPSTEGVIWAAGSGVYKSSDHGKSFEMVFPDPETVTSHGNQYENVNHWIYSSGDYIPQYQIKSVAIDRSSGGQRVFAAQQVNGDTSQFIRVFKTENGKDFSTFTDLAYSKNIQLDFDESRKCLIAVTEVGISEIDLNGDLVWSIEKSIPIQTGNVISFDSYYNLKTQKNTFAFSAYEDGLSHATTALYVTDDLRAEQKYTNLVEGLVQKSLADIKPNTTWREEGYASYEFNEWVDGDTVKHTLDWQIKAVHVSKEDSIYFYQESSVPQHDKDGNSTNYTRNVRGFCRYKAGKYSWIYGGPHFYPGTLQNCSWQDYDLSGCCFGMSAYPGNDDVFIFSTIGSVYYTEDGEHIYQRHCTLSESMTLIAKNNQGQEKEITVTPTSTNGLDVQTTYKTAVDPFNSDHLLMACTDIGLIQSFDGGRSWVRTTTCWKNGVTESIPASYRNTCYDIIFDEKQEGVVYALWCGRHNMPYAPKASDLSENGAFATSYDGGTTWTLSSIREKDQVIPYRMDIDFDENGRSIYVATMGHGFFVSRDGGKSFTPMNEGIPTSAYFGADKPAIFGNEILSCKGGIFAITGGVSWAQKPDPNDASKSVFDRALYKWNDAKACFEEIALPADVASVRDIEYNDKDSCLYIAAIGKSNFYNMKKTGGGIYRYQDGSITQIFDESKFVWGISFDSTGRLYAAMYRGEVYRFIENNTKAELLKGGMFHALKDIEFGATDDVMYISTLGGGMYRMKLKTVKR